MILRKKCKSMDKHPKSTKIFLKRNKITKNKLQCPIHEYMVRVGLCYDYGRLGANTKFSRKNH